MKPEILVECALLDQDAAMPDSDPDFVTRAASSNEETLITAYRRNQDIVAGYHYSLSFRLTGAFETFWFPRVLDRLVDRHVSLRTVYSIDQCLARQIVSVISRDVCRIVDATDWSDLTLSNRLQKDRTRQFDFVSGPLFRAFVYRRGTREHVVVLSAHPIVADLISLQTLLDEFCAICSELASGQDALASTLIENSAAYTHLRQAEQGSARPSAIPTSAETEPTPLNLPADHRSSTRTLHSRPNRSTLFAIAPETLKEVNSWADNYGVQRSSILLAGYYAFLSRYGSDFDIQVSLEATDSRPPGSEGVVGNFSNREIIRLPCPGEISFRRLVAQVHAALSTAHQTTTPFGLPRNTAANPAIPAFAWEEIKLSQGSGALQADSLKLETLSASHSDSDLILRIQSLGSLIRPAFLYCPDRFNEMTVERFADQFAQLLKECLLLPDEPIGDLEMVTANEKSLILKAAVGETTAFPRLCLHQLFSQNASLYPDAEAVAFQDRRLTYRELDEESNRIAQFLIQHGIQPEDRVGLFMERSADMISCILGILKAGGVYVPIDPDYPEERIKFIAEDTALTCVLTHRAVAFPAQFGIRLIEIDGGECRLDEYSVESVPDRSTPESIAVVIYTSGSTGQPKGACIPHRAVMRTVCETNYINVLKSDRVAQAGSPSFDAAISEIWLPLANGAALVGISRNVLLDMKQLRRVIETERISVMVLNTSYVHQIGRDAPDVLKGVRKILFGGEAAEPGPLRMLLQHVEPGALVNGYGPAEGCVITTYHEICSVPDDDVTVPIGKPVSNAAIYLLDGKGKLVPIGVPGEIYIGGQGVARGYWNRTELTERRFVPDTFATQSGGLLYRTGDLARLRANGDFEFVGRQDEMVKIRGHRIELAEVRHAITSHLAVKQAFLMVREDQPGDRRLVAYVTLNQKLQTPEEALRLYCKRRLPQHMLPAAFVIMNSIPLNANGKVDRKALPSPHTRPESTERFQAARSDLEQKLERIWRELLQIEKVGILDNFFDLGGHSLLAARLIARIEKETGQNIPVATLFEAPTIAALAQKITDNSYQSAWSPLVELRVAANRQSVQPPFFCVHSLGANLTSLYRLASLLGDDRSVYGLQPHGLDRTEAPVESIQTMATAYLDLIRRKQPRGPYYLGGVCLGGVVAYEMAQQLLSSGEEVALIALVDSFMPGDLVYLHSRSDLAQYIDAHLGEIFLRSGLARVKYVLQWLANGGIRFKTYIGFRERSSLAHATRRIAAAHRRAILAYKPKPYRGKVVQFLCSDASVRSYEDRRLAWSSLVSGGFEVQIVPGNHLNMVEEPNIRVLAEQLQLRLSQAAAGNLPLPVDSSSQAVITQARKAKRGFRSESSLGQNFARRALKPYKRAKPVGFQRQAFAREVINDTQYAHTAASPQRIMHEV